MKVENLDKETLRSLESSLSEELKLLEPTVLTRASRITNEDTSVQSLHGYIGGKNNEYVDSIRSQFPSPDDFISQWIKGLLDKVNDIESKQKQKYNGNVYQTTPTHRMVRLVKDQKIFDYLLIFLKRNFYRNLIERTRAKPNEVHWALWFGDNQIPWGLIIAPAYRNGRWTNDVSEIRRASYMYWTVGHVLTTGLIDPETTDCVSFPNLESFIRFYQSVLKRLSRSQYEKQLADCYLNYLRESQVPEEVPFLVPELRYAGLDIKHRYRLFFTQLSHNGIYWFRAESSIHSYACRWHQRQETKRYQY